MIVTNFTPVIYSYDVAKVTTFSTTIAYSYGSTVYNEISNRIEGYKAPITQQILNNLPQWNKMRQSYNSNGWKLTNSWGIGLENVLENINKRITDLNLATADTKYISNLYYSDVTSKELLEGRQSRNLLFNSSFSIKDCTRYNLPAGWLDYSVDQDTYLDYRNSIMSPVSISSNTGSIKVGQEVILDNADINKATASIYVKSNATTVSIYLNVVVEKMDGTSSSFTIQSNKKSIEWTRIVLPISITGNVYRINFSVIASCSSKVSICAPQLELGSLTSWTSSLLDSIPYLRSSSIFNAVYSVPVDVNGKKIPIFNINVEQDFLDVGIPTRIEKVSIPSKGLFFTEDKLFGRKVEVLGDITSIEFDIVENKIKERSTGPSIWDFFGSYDIRDLRFFEELRFGTTVDSSVLITPLASAIRKDYLFVACKEEYRGTTRRLIKILIPRTPPSGELYLESLIDFDLGISFEDILDIDQITDDEIASIQFSDGDPTYMVVVTTNNIKHYYRLYFDYYYFNSNTNRLYTIENYGNSKISVL